MGSRYEEWSANICERGHNSFHLICKWPHYITYNGYIITYNKYAKLHIMATLYNPGMTLNL